MRTLIIIPAYNEANNIARTVECILNCLPEYDYVVVNDGSKDSTAQICQENNYCLLNLPTNLGLAGAFQAGMKYAYLNGYDAAVQFDGDGQHRPEYIPVMEREIEKGYDIVIGSRFLTEKKPHSLRMLGNTIISGCIQLTTGKKIQDTTSGMRMYDRRVMELFAKDGSLGPEPDTISYLIRNFAKVKEVQVIIDERVAGESYLTFARSVKYMATVCTSILAVQWFRRKLPLKESVAT